jgi:hypothetical protein
MQAKFHRWAAADPGRRFDDLFNFVHDPATLTVAFDRVAGNHGANIPGVDGLTAADVEEATGMPGFLDDLRARLKTGTFTPLPVRERTIPKPGGSGKVRRLGIPAIADRVVQAALKLVLELIFEAGFLPVSYGFRPGRRAHDAIAEIQRYGTKGYQWVHTLGGRIQLRQGAGRLAGWPPRLMSDRGPGGTCPFGGGAPRAGRGYRGSTSVKMSVSPMPVRAIAVFRPSVQTG